MPTALNTVIEGNVKVKGNLSPTSITMPANSVPNAAIPLGDPIDSEKLEHRYKPGTDFGLAIGATPAAAHRIVFVADRSGTVRSVSALLNDTGTSTDVEFDLLKNGVSMLSAPITITHSEDDREVLEGTLSGAGTFVAGDVLSLQLAVTSTTGAQGPYAWLDVDELGA